MNTVIIQTLNASKICLVFNISVDANSVHPDLTAPIKEQSDLDLHSLLKRLQNI